MRDHVVAERIAPAMPPDGPAMWPGAVWIGHWNTDTATPSSSDELTLANADGYRQCRFLVTTGGRSRGFVQLPVEHGVVSRAEFEAAAAALPARPAALVAPPEATPVTVTISTRNRPGQLADALRAVLAIDYPALSVLIVDNASDSQETEAVVRASGDDRVRYVREDRVGLSYGRNRALVEARTPIVVFTDDDTVVDPGWVAGIAEAFTDDVGLVTGMVPTGELASPAQQYFENLTGWSHSCEPRVFRLAEPPADIRAFPLDVGHYGTGANFALRRDLAIRLGGFNEALGIGSPTHGGEDLDMFVRVLYAGWALAYTPDAVVWHRHRADAAELERAVLGYSVSFSAWMTALVENPRVRRDALRIGLKHVTRRLREVASPRRTPGATGDSPAQPEFSLAEHGFDQLPAAGLRALATGPRAYIRSRRSGRATRPLLGLRADAS